MLEVFILRLYLLHPYTMVMSKSQNDAAMKHILEVVFDRDDESKLHQALKLHGIDSPQAICNLKEQDIYLLTYPDYESNTLEYLQCGYHGHLRVFKAFVAHQA